MIEEISIRDLGVIRDANLQFGSGFNVLTGETGAGKTMILTALGLLLGERADSSAIRQGQDTAMVEGRWKLEGQTEIESLVVEAGGTVDSGELLVNRSVSKDGRSRAAAGGVSAPINLLATLGEKLVVVHGQSDQIRLKSASAQREALDQFANLHSALGNYRRVFEDWQNCGSRITEIEKASSTRASEIEAMRLALEELEQLKPVRGEDETLAALAEKLTHSEELRIAAAEAHELISSEGFEDATDAIGLIGKARRILEQAATHDETLSEYASQLRELGFSLGEISGNLGGYLAGFEFGGASELEQVQERRSLIAAAIRKYGPTLDDVVDFHEGLSNKLLDLEDSDGLLEKLRLEFTQLEATLSELASALRAQRVEAASRLSNEVNQELAALAMPGASLVVEVQEIGQFNQFGRDQVSIQLSSYPGAEPRPLGKGASGGELSRIMLAIEVVLAASESALTFIFDEVDAGVGGAAATQVGLRLAKLSKRAQVIVVTHLGQVAAFADHHLQVSKSVNDEFTASSVVSLNGEWRVEEIARMLSGLGDSDTAKASARELIVRAGELINY